MIDKNEVVVIAVPPIQTGGVIASMIENWGVLAREVLLAEGYPNVSTKVIPWAFFTRAHSTADMQQKHFNDYLLLLRAVADGSALPEEQDKHIRMLKLYHDMFSHQLPTDTVMTFSPTLTMVVLTNQI